MIALQPAQDNGNKKARGVLSGVWHGTDSAPGEIGQ
jgi:hypothetical protein